MDSHQLKGNWKQVKGRAKEKWGELTNDDLEQIEGRQEALVGKIQERYGKNRDAASREVDEWLDSLAESSRR